MAKKIKIGLVGAGRMGKLHAENIRSFIPDAEIGVVADLQAECLKSWAESCGGSSLASDYRRVIEDPEIDAVLISSSTDSHASIIIEAAQAGKHIFCEKPVDLSLSKVKKVLAEVEKAGVIFQVGFNRRFDHNHRAVKEAVMAGKVGEPHLILITSRDPEPPPLQFIGGSGGLFLDMSIHDFDMARYLSNREVLEVYATGAVLVDPAIGEAGDIDTAVITLKLTGGVIGVINNSRKAVYGYDQRVEVFGSAGSVANFNDTPSTTVISSGSGICSEKPLFFFRERYRQSFIDELKDFVEAVAGNRKPLVSGYDGLQAALIAEAANKSLAENRPVRISEIEQTAGA
jgi:myo-inositol 2-dehydrogenase / D-chiro-inositol 1-dehydrogenase